MSESARRQVACNKPVPFRCPSETTQVVESGGLIVGAGVVPAGLKTVTISNFTGVNTVAGNYQIGNNRRPDSISLDATNHACINGVLPEIPVTGTGQWEYIGIR